MHSCQQTETHWRYQSSPWSLYEAFWGWRQNHQCGIECRIHCQATKCIKQHRRKHDTEKSGNQDTSLFNPICDGKGFGAFSFVLHAVMKLSNNGDECFGAAVFHHDSPKAVSADHVKCLGRINMSNRGQCSVPDTFLAAVLQQTPYQQSHVPYRRHIDSPVRIHVRDGCWGASDRLWLGSCPKLKVRRFCCDYHMPVCSLSVGRYRWWRCSWSPAVVVLLPISSEWGSEVYPSVLIHLSNRFLQELNQIQVLCCWIVDG